ncbi:hypothetical protein J6590_098904 [Homalodisca vitripennis]|nr:hypothetical protein J6590_098904 [Homalodisca vitripennis]
MEDSSEPIEALSKKSNIAVNSYKYKHAIDLRMDISAITSNGNTNEVSLDADWSLSLESHRVISLQTIV